MSADFGYKILLENKLINLPVVNTIAHLYKNSHLEVVNKVCDVFFNDTSQLDFRIKEVEDLIEQNLMVRLYTATNSNNLHTLYLFRFLKCLEDIYVVFMKML